VNKHIQQQEEEKEGFTVVSLDESFFFYDSIVRRVWIEDNKRLIVRITGSQTFMYLLVLYTWKERSSYLAV
jgi:hypothetical protein